MKKIIFALLFFVTSCASLQDNSQLGQKYVPGTEDLPVYEGFSPLDTKNVVFDSESGRIVDATYSANNIQASEVKQFYDETLAQLGWKKKKSGEYSREGEDLKVLVTTKGNLAVLKFSIRPAK